MKISSFPLSKLKPLAFEYINNEQLKKDSFVFDNGFSYEKYKLFENLQDLTYSNKNLLFLTEKKDINEAFVEFEPVNFLDTGGAFYLQDSVTQKFLTNVGDELYFSGTESTKLLINAKKNTDNSMSLYAENDKILEVGDAYPYQIKLKDPESSPKTPYQRSFNLNHYENYMTCKVKISPTEFRFLCSRAIDNKVLAIGLMLGNQIYNNYKFVANFVTNKNLTKGDNKQTTEIFYWNNFASYPTNKDVTLQLVKNADTNYLASTTLHSLCAVLPLNLMPLKTNFTCQHSYNYEGTKI